MLKQLAKTMLTAGVLSAALGSTAYALSPAGDTIGAIHVISEDNQTWTKVKAGVFQFQVDFSAQAAPSTPLNRVWVVQGNALDVTHHAIYDSGNINGDLVHNFQGQMQGGTLHILPAERDQIVAKCNAKLNPASSEQSQQEEEVQIPLSLVKQTTTEDAPVSEGIDLSESWITTDFTVPVICEPFTKAEPAQPQDEVADLGDPKIVQVELGLSTNGAVVGGTLEYTGSCPMGITLNMRWVTNIGSGLKSYIKHKDLAGQHNWTSETFNVKTDQPAYGGHWKKEMTDLISIPFAGSVPSNGGGGVSSGNNPGGIGFNPGGGSGGGLNPFANGDGAVHAGNTGTNNGLTQYIGWFQLVAYRNKQVVPLPDLDGGTENVTVYEDFKASGWRKYIVTCEPQQNVNIPQGPVGLFNPGQQDTQQIPAARGFVTTYPAGNDTPIPVNPGVVSTGQAHKAAADIARKRKVEAQKKAEAEHRRKAAKKAAEAKRRREAAKKAAEARRKREAARKLAELLRKRAAAQQAARLAAKRRLAIKRRNVAPVRVMRIRRR